MYKSNQVEIWSTSWDQQVLIKNVKNGQKGVWPGSRDLLFKFWDPLISLERLKIETWNFVCGFILGHIKQKKIHYGQKGAWPGSRDLLFKLTGDPLIYQEWPKIKTSNIACRLTVRDSEIAKIVKREHGRGHVTYFCFSDFQSESPCKGAHRFTPEWS